MNKEYFVYILTNKHNTVFYVGVTNNLERRVFEHKHHLIKSFTNRYNIEKLIYFEACAEITAAIAREKQLKNWHRAWKLNLVRAVNPTFSDLAGDPETSSG